MSSINPSHNKNHIVLLPFLAHGHIKPFVELCRLIQRRSGHFPDVNLTLTILTTPLNIPLVHKLLATDQQRSPSSIVIQARALSFRSSDHEGLPEGVENSYGLGLSLVIKLFHASVALETPLRKYIEEEIVGKEGETPLCIITDVFLGWAIDVANSFGCPGVVFSTCGAYGSAAYLSVWNDLPHRNHTTSNNANSVDDDTFTVPGLPETHRFSRSQLHRFLRYADGKDEWSRFFQPQIRKSLSATGWLCNTAAEMEPLGMTLLRNYIKLPLWAVGPTISQSLLTPNRPMTQIDPDAVRVISWLDAQPDRSVVYVSFGSQNTITAGQMMELAKGLEMSGIRFLWVVRPPFGFDIDGEFRTEEWLPVGFEERMERRGLIVRKWGPQVEILKHKATGVFVTHCGWNSVVESLSQGIPMIGWPLAAEQSYNSKYMEEEMGVAVELTRGLEGEVSCEDVKRVVGLFFEEEKEGGRGEGMKRNAVVIGERIKAALEEEGGGNDRKGSSLKALDEFLKQVVARHQNQKAV